MAYIRVKAYIYGHANTLFSKLFILRISFARRFAPQDRFENRGLIVEIAMATTDRVGGCMKPMEKVGSLFVRLAVGVSFLSAVGDRFGFWGPFGQPNVAWGDFSHFQAYTAKLNWFMPSAMIPALAWISTGAEVLLGTALVAGVYTRAAALLSGLLLLLFALSMTFALGLEAPLSASVFSASAGAFLLSTCREYPWGFDSIRRRLTASR
jgi:uncharacterized membrane protein YphA (DoxX/SURF4 family)